MIWPAVLALALAPVPTGTAQPDTLALIELAMSRNRLVQAREMIEIARRDDAVKDVVRLDILSGQLALTEGRSGDAFAYFSRVLDVQPGHCDGLEGAGLAALRLERLNAASVRLSSAVEFCPDRWRSWNALGVIADKAGRWTESEKAYGRARELAPQEVSVINNLGYSLILQSRFDEAEAILRDGLKIAPNDVRLLNNLDIAAIGGDRSLPPARPSDGPVQQAIRLNNAGYTAHLMGKKEQAEAYLRQALEVSQSHYKRAAANLDIVEKDDPEQ